MPPGVELVLRMPESDKKYLTTDNVRLQQVVNNLINNAAKFTSSGFITFGYEDDEVPGYTRIFVEDTGVGISEEGSVIYSNDSIKSIISPKEQVWD